MKKQIFVLLSFWLTNIVVAKIPQQLPETTFSEYKFPAIQCKLIEHEGSRIFIPANSFYLDNKLYEGEVAFKFRQFSDQLDIVLNKIPMTYQAGEKKYTLESGGMFEFYAYGNGKLLTIAKGKNISVQLKTNFDIAGGEVYKLNPQTKIWEKKTLFASDKNSNQNLPNSKNEYWLDSYNQDDEFGIINQTIQETISVLDSFNNFVTYAVISQEYSNLLFKTMNVNEMGFYNCDKILNESNAVDIYANFELKGYNKKLESDIYVVYKNRNAVFTYSSDKFMYNIKLLSGEDCTIFSFGGDGKIAIVDKDKLTALDLKSQKNKRLTLPMTVIKNTPTTKAELALLTGL